jgi:diamine N-acetyltransferase
MYGGREPVSLHIRPATVADLPAIHLIFEYADGYHRAALPDIFAPSDEGVRSEEYLLSILADSDGVLFIAEMDGRTAGLIYVRERHTPDITLLVPRRYAVIDSLAVLPWAQQSGVASALLVCAEVWARERGLERIELGVYEFNSRARTLYERMGYQVVRHEMAKRLATGSDPAPADHRGEC